MVIITITNNIVHHHNKSHPKIAGESEPSKDGQYRGEETKKTNQWFRTNLMLHYFISSEPTERMDSAVVKKQ